MAFKFKDLMINVTSGGGGGDTPVCTYDTVEPKPVGIAATCTYDTVPAGQAATCTFDTVKPAGQAGTCTFDTVGLRATGICTIATVFGTPFGFDLTRDTGVCTFDTVKPNFLGTVTTVTTVTTLVAGSAGPTTLAQLKAQLQQALADVEQRERAQAETEALPKSIEEVDDLERRLEGALDELREHRKTLEKGGSKGARKEGSKARKAKK
jgi:hypothetical protein